MDKQNVPEKTIPQQDIDAYLHVRPEEVPERGENNRPRESSDWINFSRWPF